MAIKKKATKPTVKKAAKPKAKPTPKKKAKAPAKPKRKAKPKAKPVINFIVEEDKPVDQLSKEELELIAEEKKRSDWEFNNEAISEAFLRLIKKHKRFPAYAAIGREVNLDERTVRRHFEKSDMLGNQMQKLKQLQDQSIITVALNAIEGVDVQWNKLLYEMASGIIGGRVTATARSSTPETPSMGGSVETEVTLQIS